MQCREGSLEGNTDPGDLQVRTKEAAHWLRAAAERGNPRAMWALALALTAGDAGFVSDPGHGDMQGGRVWAGKAEAAGWRQARAWRQVLPKLAAATARRRATAQPSVDLTKVQSP